MSPAAPGPGFGDRCAASHGDTERHACARLMEPSKAGTAGRPIDLPEAGTGAGPAVTITATITA